MTDNKDKPLLATADKALIAACTKKDGDTEGLIPLTPKLLESIKSSLDARNADIAERFPKLVEECPYETRLAVVAWAMKHIVEHAKEGGSYRYLIYDRLGFGPDAYVPLYMAGGMEISNEFDLTDGEGPKDVSSGQRRRGQLPVP